jgi:hypothetical protein
MITYTDGYLLGPSNTNVYESLYTRLLIQTDIYRDL